MWSLILSLQVIFEWDQSFVGYMFGLDALPLALSNIIAVVKMRTVGGYVPSFGGGTFKQRATTQPPVTSQALALVAQRWGVERTRWALQLCFETLFVQNTWMYTQRREAPLMLVTYGASKYDAWAPDGTSAAAHPSGSLGESGLDNGPLVEGAAPFNESGHLHQNQYSAGQTGLFLMDAKALMRIAAMLGDRSAAHAELKRRFDEVSALALRWSILLFAFFCLLILFFVCSFYSCR